MVTNLKSQHVQFVGQTDVSMYQTDVSMYPHQRPQLAARFPVSAYIQLQFHGFWIWKVYFVDISKCLSKAIVHLFGVPCARNLFWIISLRWRAADLIKVDELTLCQLSISHWGPVSNPSGRKNHGKKCCATKRMIHAYMYILSCIKPRWGLSLIMVIVWDTYCIYNV